jgi:hypothetical protein
MNERLLKRSEKTIRVGIKNIKDGLKTPKEAGIGRVLNAMKNLDEPLYDDLLEQYKDALLSPSRK